MQRLKALFDPRPRVSVQTYRRDNVRALLVWMALLCIAIWLAGQGWRIAAIVVTTASLSLVLVVLARTAGRLRDRDRTPWWLVAYGLLYGVSFAPIESLTDAYPVETLVTALAMLAFFAWFFIETWLRPGTPGPNRFGTPPSM